MENTIKYSILIPAYNAGKFIKRSIDSALNQNTQSNYEVIICNDGSTDNTLNIIQSYNNDKIKILNNETNQGGIITRKKLLFNAQGKYIVWLDADDTLELNCLSVLDKTLKEYDYDIVDFDCYVIQDENEQCIMEKNIKKLKNTSLLASFFGINHRCYLWGRCFKKEICIQHLPEDEKHPFDDIFFVMPFYYYAQSYTTINQPLYTYYYYEGFWSQQYKSNFILSEKEYDKQFKARISCFNYNLNFLKIKNVHKLYMNELLRFIDFEDLITKILKLENVEVRLQKFHELNEFMSELQKRIVYEYNNPAL